MSRETLDLFTTAGFGIGLAWGLVALAVLVGAALAHRKPTTLGGLPMVAALVGAWSMATGMPLVAVAGAAVLALGGVVGGDRYGLGVLAAAPGAALIAAPVWGASGAAAALFAWVAIIAAAPLVARFDAANAPSTIATSLLIIAFLGVFITVPDTEHAIVAVGVVLPLAFAGVPFRVAGLGGPGAFGAVGLLLWLVVTDGAARPGALVLGAGTLGVLVAEPVARMAWRAGESRMQRLVDSGFPGEVVVIAIQVGVAFAMTAIVRRTGSQVGASVVGVLIVLAGVGAVLGAPSRDRSSAS